MMRHLPRPQPARRGVALITVLVVIALLTIPVMEFLYNSRVRLALAENAAHEVKAYYAARSGINLTRLTLQFQYELANTEGMIGTAVSRSNFQLWEYLDIFLPAFTSGQISSPVGSLNLQDTGAIGFGDFEGSFDPPEVVPQEGRLNLNAFSGNVLEQEALIELCSLLAPSQYNPLFGPTVGPNDEELPTRGELIGAIIDHVDANEDMVVVDDDCQIVPSGAGGEDDRYRELSWRAKNEPFVTLDEVLAVPGVTPELLRLLGDNLTVYGVARMFHPNLADAQGFMGFLCGHLSGVDEETNPCRVPLIASQVGLIALAMEGWTEFFSSPFALLDFYLGLSTGEAEERVTDGVARGQMIAFRREDDFRTVLRLFSESPETALEFAAMADPQRALIFGLVANAAQGAIPQFQIQFDEEAMMRRISVDTPRVFSVTSTGRYGTAVRAITTVLDYTQGGRMLYWREY